MTQPPPDTSWVKTETIPAPLNVPRLPSLMARVAANVGWACAMVIMVAWTYSWVRNLL